MDPINYSGKERLWRAIDALATGDGSIQERLAGAANILTPLMERDFPESARAEFEAVMGDLTKVQPTGNEGTILATTRTLTAEQGAAIARRIFGIYTEIHDGL